MKYPFVIFYRKEIFNCIDNFFIQNSSLLDCSIFIANSIEYVKNLHNSNFQLLLTYGDNYEEHCKELLTVISKEMLQRHVHISTDHDVTKNIDFFNNFINGTYVRICVCDRVYTRPTFSLFTPSYNSYNKILRVYNSLQKQTLLDWEWVIIDDSPDDLNFQFLRTNFSHDPRIRFYRRSNNNGSIGNVKNETIGLCRGKYLVEMDHDDELMPYVLQESADLFNTNENIGFIYYDCACVYENGTNQWYGDFICKGYGGYYSQKYEDNWRLVYVTPNINNITMSHLVCCPNHPRIWRKDVLLKMGSYCEYLPICDDYEILLRTVVSTNIAKIHKLGYIQYMNDSNNNFSLIRNSEINRIGPNYIYPNYFSFLKINDFMKINNAFENETYVHQHTKIWERDQITYKYKYCNLIVNNDYDLQICIIGFDSLLANIDEITELYNNSRNDFILLENKCSLSYLQERIERYNFTRMKCYTLIDTPIDQLINYFKLLYLSVPNYRIININLQKPVFNTDIYKRSQIINKLTNSNDKYLEIGVEYGECFNETHFINKVGVDPDPKFTPKDNQELYIQTSDNFFKQYDNKQKFDVIFIDGMHQAEYVLCDINNSIQILSSNGTIFMDDILPFNYNEQLKIPIKHYYENGILKYGENWTGDVWKVLYHILKNYQSKLIDFKYFYNINFRGIGALKFKEVFQIDCKEIDTINSYDYFQDYSKYINILQCFYIDNKL
jgi:glycosyltransferase involved in cell wall biosynthesis